MDRFAEWRARFEPLYGEAATRSLYRAHRALGDCPEPGEYARIVPPEVRRLLGEYYTPPWLVEQVLQRAGYAGERMLDPACGAGAFLAPCGSNAAGWDIHPLAVRMAQACCPLAAIREQDAFTAPEAAFGLIAGNPPWVNWRRLGASYRARVEPLWSYYELFTANGLSARLGGAMDDLSALMTYACADRYLAPGGRLAFLLPAALFQSAGGGARFRSFTLPGGFFLRVVSVEEVDHPRPFEGATTRAAIAVFEKSRTATVYPVHYLRGGEECDAQPIAADPTSPWAVVPRGLTGDFADLRGSSTYRGRVGAHTGGAAGVYWIDILEDRGATLLIRNRANAGRNKFDEVTADVERDLVHPLVRGRDLKDGRARPSGYILVPHTANGKPVTEDTMRTRFPLTFAWFERFREPMLGRAHYRQHFKKSGMPYWSMYNVGPYTFAPHRVAWREQSSTFQAATLECGHIADAKLVTVAVDSAEEARYLAGFLNTERVRAYVGSYVLKTQISTHVMSYLRVPPAGSSRQHMPSRSPR